MTQNVTRYLQVAMFLLLFAFKSQAQTINTIAGNGTYGYSGDGGPATSAQLWDIASVAVDGLGNIYIEDNYNQVIRKVSTNGTISTVAGNGTQGYSGDGGPATSAQLNNPTGVAADGSGNIYIADAVNNVIRKVSTNGNISTVAGNGTASYSGDGGAATSAQLWDPEGVAVDGSGNIYIADYDNNRIRKVNTSGIISTVAGNGTPGYSGDGGAATSAELSVGCMAVDGSGNIYIAGDGYSSVSCSLREVTNAGGNTTTTPVPLTLDKIGLSSSTTAATAYSLRLLSSSYTGKAINVLRSNDNATLDIGFTSNGDLDTASLKTFIGSNSGFVTVWYDQSGNGNDLSQATAGNQPRLVNAGVIDRENGRPFIRFFGVQNVSYNSLNLSSAQTTTGTAIIVNKFASGGGGFILGSTSSYYYSSSPPLLFDSYWASSSIKGASVWQNGASVGSSAVWNTNLMVNSIEPQTPSSGTDWDNIGRDRSYNHLTDGGGYSELLTFSNAISTADREAVESNQHSYYSIIPNFAVALSRKT